MNNKPDNKTEMNPGIAFFIEPLKQRWKLAAGIIILVLGITLVRAYQAKPFYRMSFYISCHYPFTEEVKLVGDNLKANLDMPFSQSEVRALAKNFQNQVNDPGHALKYFTANINHSPRENTAMEIVFEVYDTTRVADLSLGFVKYLNANSFFAKKLQQERQQQERLLAELDKQLGPGTGIAGLEAKGFQDRDAYINMVEKREAALRKLNKLSGYEISVPPVAPSAPSNLSLSRKMILALVWGSILAVLLTFFLGLIYPKK